MVVASSNARWRTRSASRTATGVLGELRPYEAVLVVIALAAFGFFAPLFGLLPAAFVAVDVVVGWWRGRTEAPGNHE